MIIYLIVSPFQPVLSTCSCSNTWGKAKPNLRRVPFMFFFKPPFSPLLFRFKSKITPKNHQRIARFSPHCLPLVGAISGSPGHPRFANSHGSIVVPHGPSAVGDLQGQIRDGFLQAASQRLGSLGGAYSWMGIVKPFHVKPGLVNPKRLSSLLPWNYQMKWLFGEDWGSIVHKLQ